MEIFRRRVVVSTSWLLLLSLLQKFHQICHYGWPELSIVVRDGHLGKQGLSNTLLGIVIKGKQGLSNLSLFSQSELVVNFILGIVIRDGHQEKYLLSNFFLGIVIKGNQGLSILSLGIARIVCFQRWSSSKNLGIVRNCQ